MVNIYKLPSRSGIAFSTVLRITNSEFVLEQQESERKSVEIEDWSSASCDLKGNNPCTITKCHGNTVLANKKCNKYFEMHIAMRLSNTKSLDQLGDLLSCLVKSHIDGSLNVSQKTNSTVYKVDNTNLHGAIFGLYLKAEPKIPELEFFARTIGVLLPHVLFKVKSQKSAVDSGKSLMSLVRNNETVYRIQKNNQHLSESFLFCGCFTFQGNVEYCYMRCFNRIESGKEWQEKAKQLRKDACIIEFLDKTGASSSGGLLGNWYGNIFLPFYFIIWSIVKDK